MLQSFNQRESIVGEIADPLDGKTLGRSGPLDGKTYKLEGSVQSEQAYKSGLSFQGKPIEWALTDDWGYPLKESRLYQLFFGKRWRTCGMQLFCNGCSQCGKREAQDN